MSLVIATAPPVETSCSGAAPTPLAGFSDLFDPSGHDVAADIETSGVACLRGVVADHWLSEARNAIATQFPMRGAHELLVARVANGRGHTFADRLIGDMRLRTLLESVVAAAGMSQRADAGLQADLRLVNGPGPANKPPGFHYDGSVLTMVVPIVIPDAEPGRRGELVLCPNRRPYRRSVITNVLEKFAAQNDLSRRRFLSRAPGNHRVEMVDLEPGNAYFFWGYRSYHATMPCPENASRATLIVHFANFHRDSALLMGAMALGRKVREFSRTLSTPPGSYQVLAGTP
ncbi:MAG: hypothetical protein QOH60_4786 [Mycobacterium sp.]|jgi:hypothetical protein|nr:hypothetical protein [Mycobacterium sp.]